MNENFNISSDKLSQFFLEITGNDTRDKDYIDNLVNAYPNVLDFMLNDMMPDLTNVKYVKYKRYNYLKEKAIENIDLLQLNNKLNDVFSLSLLKTLKSYYSNIVIDNNLVNDIIVKNLYNEPYDTLCRINNISFAKADKILLEANKHKNNFWQYDIASSKQRCVAFIIWYLINNLNGSTYSTLEKLKSVMLYKYFLNDCIHTLDSALTDKRITYVNNKVMLTSVYLQEQNISRYVQNAIQKENSVNFNININKYKQIDNITLSDTQMDTLRLINDNQLVLLNGFAGTGKSQSVKALINMLEDNDKTYIIVAPTAKAAKQIGNYADRPACTIHYLLSKEFQDLVLDDMHDYPIMENSTFDEYQLLNYDVVIADETSMISIELFNKFIRHIDYKRTKLLLIGDSFQLPSIQNGNLYQDLLSINDIPKVTLNQIFRYKENGLVNVATNIRLGNRYLSNSVDQYIGDSYEFHKHIDVMEMINAALTKYMELIENGNSVQDIAILTAKNIGNSGINLINSCIQRVINEITEFDETVSIKVDNKIIKFKENDLVMNIKNNYNVTAVGEDQKTLLANGQIGTVKQVNEIMCKMRVEFDGKLFDLDYENICNLRLAYGFTIHKSQGSQFKNVIYLTPYDDLGMTNSNLMYVAVTRAQHKCFHYGSDYVINQKINEKENLKRNTTLINQYYYNTI